MVRRALSGLDTQEDQEQEQREAILHTKCTISGKVCSLIIDRHNYTNVAFKILPDKLELSTALHPSPNGQIKGKVYKITNFS